jgi:hypothetical protein
MWRFCVLFQCIAAMQHSHDKDRMVVGKMPDRNFPLIFNDLLQDCCTWRLIASGANAKAKEQVTGCIPHVGDRRALRG